jgi:hypothetical protein
LFQHWTYANDQLNPLTGHTALFLRQLHKTARSFYLLIIEAHCVEVGSVKRLDLYCDTVGLYTDTPQPEGLAMGSKSTEQGSKKCLAIKLFEYFSPNKTKNLTKLKHSTNKPNTYTISVDMDSISDVPKTTSAFVIRVSHDSLSETNLAMNWRNGVQL